MMRRLVPVALQVQTVRRDGRGLIVAGQVAPARPLTLPLAENARGQCSVPTTFEMSSRAGETSPWAETVTEWITASMSRRQ